MGGMGEYNYNLYTTNSYLEARNTQHSILLETSLVQIQSGAVTYSEIPHVLSQYTELLRAYVDRLELRRNDVVISHLHTFCLQ